MLQRNMLGQENRKESSRVSNMKCSQSPGKPRGCGGTPFTEDKEVSQDSLLHYLFWIVISMAHSVVASVYKEEHLPSKTQVCGKFTPPTFHCKIF